MTCRRIVLLFVSGFLFTALGFAVLLRWLFSGETNA